MKRKYALILVFALLLQSFGIQVGAENVEGWTFSRNGSFTEQENIELCLAESADRYKFDGDKSLLVKCQKPEKVDSDYIEIKNPLSKELESGKYKLSFFVKTTAVFEGEIYLGDAVAATIGTMTVANATAPSGETKWKEYSAEIDYTKTADISLSFRFYNNIKSIYIDNVTLTTVDGTENYVVDSGFEAEIKVEENTGGGNGGDDSGNTGGGGDDSGNTGDDTTGDDVPGDDLYDTKAYQPTSLLSSGYAGGVLLSWKNPSTSDLEDIKIYDMTEGEEVLLSDTVSVTPSTIIYYKAECAESKCYQYKIVFSYKTKEDRIYYLSDFPGDKGSFASGKWNLREYMAGAAKYCPADVYIDSTMGHESDTSLKIVSNIDRNITALQSNIYTLITRSIGMDSGKKYYISFWIKGENVKNAPQAHMNFVKFEGSGNVVAGSTGTYDWTKKEYTYTYTTQNSLVLLVEGLCDALWFDDFVCYELDENGEITGDNLIEDGDFESVISKDTSSPSNFKTEAGIGSVKLSFNKPADKYNGMKLYQKVFDKYEYRGIISGEVDNFEITGLGENQEYTFKVVPFNKDLHEGEAKEFTVTTLLRDYDISAPVVYKSDTAVSELSGTGEYKVVTTAKNNLLDEDLVYEQLVGIYEGNTLIKVYSTKQSVLKTEQNAPYSTTETTFIVPEIDNCRVKIFVVESRINPELYYRMELK